MRLRDILAAGAWCTWAEDDTPALLEVLEQARPAGVEDAIYTLTHELHYYVLIEFALGEYKVRCYPTLGAEQTYGAGVKLSFRGPSLLNILAAAVARGLAINCGRVAYGVSGVEHCEPVL